MRMKKGDLMRDEILIAAEKLFFEDGYESTSIQDILDVLKLSKGGFYHYFPSKEAVLREICEKRIAERLRRAEPELYAGRVRPMDKLNRLLSMVGLFDWGDTQYAAMMLRLCYQGEGDAKLCESLRKTAREQLLAYMNGVIADGIAAGTLCVRYPNRAGEIVLDPFSGSGTTLEAAKRCGRDFIGVDQSRITMNILRRRLSGADYRIECADAADTAECRADAHAGVGFYHVDLHIFRPESTPDDRTFDALDVIDNWSVGYIRGGEYHVYEEFFRSRKTPELQTTLNAPVYSGQLAMCVNDVYGRRYLFEIGPE